MGSRCCGRSCWIPPTRGRWRSSTGSCWACGTARATSRRPPESRTRTGRTGWCCRTPPAPPASRSSRWRSCRSRPGQRVRARRCCTWTWRCPRSRTWTPSTLERWPLARGCCATAPTTPTSPCGCTPTSPATRSASSWPRPHPMTRPLTVLCRKAAEAAAPQRLLSGAVRGLDPRPAGRHEPGDHHHRKTGAGGGLVSGSAVAVHAGHLGWLGGRFGDRSGRRRAGGPGELVGRWCLDGVVVLRRRPGGGPLVRRLERLPGGRGTILGQPRLGGDGARLGCLRDPGLRDPGLRDPGLGDPGLGDPGLRDPGLGGGRLVVDAVVGEQGGLLVGGQLAVEVDAGRVLDVALLVGDLEAVADLGGVQQWDEHLPGAEEADVHQRPGRVARLAGEVELADAAEGAAVAVDD